MFFYTVNHQSSHQTQILDKLKKKNQRKIFLKNYFNFFLSTKINIATNLIFRLISITNACLLDSSSLSKFMDSKQLTFTNLIEKSLYEFQVNVICTFHSL